MLAQLLDDGGGQARHAHAAAVRGAKLRVAEKGVVKMIVIVIAVLLLTYA